MCTGLFIGSSICFSPGAVCAWAWRIAALWSWFCLSGSFLALTSGMSGCAVLGWVCFAVGSLVVVEKGMKIPSGQECKPITVRRKIAFRAMFGGTVYCIRGPDGQAGRPALGAGYLPRSRPSFLSTLVIIIPRVGGADFFKSRRQVAAGQRYCTSPTYALQYGFSILGPARPGHLCSPFLSPSALGT